MKKLYRHTTFKDLIVQGVPRGNNALEGKVVSVNAHKPVGLYLNDWYADNFVEIKTLNELKGIQLEGIETKRGAVRTYEIF
jgi:hypothetical protein